MTSFTAFRANSVKKEFAPKDRISTSVFNFRIYAVKIRKINIAELSAGDTFYMMMLIDSCVEPVRPFRHIKMEDLSLVSHPVKYSVDGGFAY